MTSPPPLAAPVLSEIVVRPVERDEEPRYRARMAAHHDLGALPKIGETLWYVAHLARALAGSDRPAPIGLYLLVRLRF